MILVTESPTVHNILARFPKSAILGDKFYPVVLLGSYEKFIADRCVLVSLFENRGGPRKEIAFVLF